jgi:hypothetical protein
MRDRRNIIVSLKRAIYQYEKLPQHSTEQEMAMWAVEAAIEDLSRFNSKQGENNEQISTNIFSSEGY